MDRVEQIDRVLTATLQTLIEAGIIKAEAFVEILKQNNSVIVDTDKKTIGIIKRTK